MPTNMMVENIVAIELAYVNTRHPDFYKDMANISSMLKSPDLETERMNQVRLQTIYRNCVSSSSAIYSVYRSHIVHLSMDQLVQILKFHKLVLMEALIMAKGYENALVLILFVSLDYDLCVAAKTNMLIIQISASGTY